MGRVQQDELSRTISYILRQLIENRTSNSPYLTTKLPRRPAVSNKTGVAEDGGKTMISSRIRVGKSIVLAIAGALFAILIGFGISAQTQLFSDDFQDGNDSGWTKSSGTWSVVTDGSLAYRQS